LEVSFFDIFLLFRSECGPNCSCFIVLMLWTLNMFVLALSYAKYVFICCKVFLFILPFVNSTVLSFY
jgi:hypothetical protein